MAKKYGLDPRLIMLIRGEEGGRVIKDQTLKTNGLEAGKTYRLYVQVEQIGGGPGTVLSSVSRSL